MRALFRVDADMWIGSGHLFRCLTLARALRNKGVTVAFVCGQLHDKLAAAVRSQGFTLYLLDAPAHRKGSEPPQYPFSPDEQIADANAVLDAVRSEFDYSWIIVDHYGLDQTWEAVLRPKCRRMLVIEDLTHRSHRCDMLLNQNIGSQEGAQLPLLEQSGCRLLLGPKYALLGEDFVQARQVCAPRSGEVHSVLVSFGGSDPTAEAFKAVAALRHVNGLSGGIDVVGGAANTGIARLEALCRNDHRVRFHPATNEMARLASRADLAIGACGTSSWERCALYLPAVAIIVADNQRVGSETLATSGAAHVLGWHQEVSEADIRDAVTALCKSPELLSGMSRLAGGLVDGRGTERVVREMESLYEGSRAVH